METIAAESLDERLAAVLLSRELITPEQRDWAMAAREQAGTSLSVILITAGLLHRLSLYPVLAELGGVPFIDLAATPLDPEVIKGLDPAQLTQEGWVPVRLLPDGSMLVATEHQPGPRLVASAEQALGRPATFHITTDWDIRRALAAGLRQEILDQASLGLWQRSAIQSARTALYLRQKIAIGAGLVLLAVCGWRWPYGTVQVVSVTVATLFLISVVFKFAVCMAGARRERFQAVTAEEVAQLSDDDLPVYTVLAPMFHEANVVADLVTNLTQLDYPVSKLEVLLMLEEDDSETIEAAKAARMPTWMQIIRVPAGHPQTKPKACNVGLFFARGEHLVIYDAEDKPDPDQLKKAVVAFRRGGEQMVCVQAALNYWNVNENFLTRMFTAEYSFWFDYMLPGLDALRLPIPLGGTSNHFRTEGLRRLGGWDPFNVTEDADLGMRASALGYTVGVINSTTFEEANRNFGNWIRQRSRWIKGYMQTSLVHARAPWSLIGAIGPRQAAGFALLIAGTPMSFLFVLPLYTLFAASLVFGHSRVFSLMYPGWTLWIALFDLLIGNALMIYISMMGAFLRRRYGLVLWAMLNPVYWLLHSVASYKALWQLITRPHYWEKTTHGISALSASEAPAVPGTAAGTAAAVPAAPAAGQDAADVPQPRLPG